MTNVLLYSGGLDSFILNYLYNPDKLLYIKTGSKYEKKELDLLQKFSEYKGIENKVEICDLSFLGNFEQSNSWIPLRNLFFLNTASLYGDKVYMGALHGETTKDKGKYFKNKTENLIGYLLDDIMNEGHKKVEIKFPFKKKSKSEILKMYIKNNGSIDELFRFSVSCYDTERLRCGECNSCVRRWVAEEINNLNTTDMYDSNPIEFIKSSFNNFSIGTKIRWMFSKQFLGNWKHNIELYRVMRKYG